MPGKPESCELVAIAAHPDDAELACGGTLAAFAKARTAAIVDLTQGERASRGTVEERAKEAQKAAQVLGVARHTLALPDTGLDANQGTQRQALVTLLRQLRPRYVLIPHPKDPHPDHRQAHALARAALFLAGVAGYGKGEPHKPELVLVYPGPRQLFSPHLVVDVTAVYAQKQQALACYATQFAAGKFPPTHLASGYFLAAVEGRDRAFGNLVGAELGEGFRLLGPALARALAGFLGELA